MVVPFLLLVDAKCYGASVNFSHWNGQFRQISPDTFPIYKQWTAMQARMRAGQKTAGKICPGEEDAVCIRRRWTHFLAGIATAPIDRQIAAVNLYINAAAYVSDYQNWAQSDYWASPVELLSRGGDCEDFAIAKYFSLRRLGYPAAAMRVLVLFDALKKQVHAVLAVSVRGEIVVLDNLWEEPQRLRELRHYHPLYAINEKGVWLHATNDELRPTAFRDGTGLALYTPQPSQ